MSQKEILLAAQLLDDAADERGNHICNDWNFPEDWTQDEQTAFVKAYHDYNGVPEEFDPAHLHLPDFAVMSFLAYKLKESASDKI